MFYEAMEEILPEMTVIIQDGQGNTLNLLDLAKEQTAAAPETNQEG